MRSSDHECRVVPTSSLLCALPTRANTSWQSIISNRKASLHAYVSQRLDFIFLNLLCSAVCLEHVNMSSFPKRLESHSMWSAMPFRFPIASWLCPLPSTVRVQARLTQLELFARRGVRGSLHIMHSSFIMKALYT